MSKPFRSAIPKQHLYFYLFDNLIEVIDHLSSLSSCCSCLSLKCCIRCTVDYACHLESCYSVCCPISYRIRPYLLLVNCCELSICLICNSVHHKSHFLSGNEVVRIEVTIRITVNYTEVSSNINCIVIPCTALYICKVRCYINIC